MQDISEWQMGESELLTNGSAELKEVAEKPKSLPPSLVPAPLLKQFTTTYWASDKFQALYLAVYIHSVIVLSDYGTVVRFTLI